MPTPMPMPMPTCERSATCKEKALGFSVSVRRRGLAPRCVAPTQAVPPQNICPRTNILRYRQIFCSDPALKNSLKARHSSFNRPALSSRSQLKYCKSLQLGKWRAIIEQAMAQSAF
eukprot:5476217-Pleurochrysis_carterae.AAC.1